MKIFDRVKEVSLVLTFLLILSGLTVSLSAQGPENLPRSIPELEGVSSSGIIDFLNAIDTGRQEIHSFMFLRHGKVIAEGWWDPYGPDHKHLLYSASKTFTATAVGLAIAEGKLKITDKVISFFPYSLPDTIGEYMKILTVRDLLTMSVGQDPEPRTMGISGDWINVFLSTEPVFRPGTRFMYNNMATFMLSAIVQQVSGQPIFDYLQPRIFRPLAIRGIDWDLNPQGINLGMIGLRLHTEDMAKFGQLLLQGGTWNKKQLIKKEWINEATSYKIANSNPDSKLPDEMNDWAQGYCYQMWRGRNNTVRLDGMAGQFVILIPDKDVVVVLTANARNTQDEINLVHNYLIPAIKSEKSIPDNPRTYSELQKKMKALAIKQQVSGLPKSEFEERISGKEFILDDNRYNIQSVYFAFENEECTLALKRDNQISSFKTGHNNWKMSNTTTASLLSPPRTMSAKSIDANYTVPRTSVKAGACYSWTDKSTLEITARFVEESLGSETIVCRISESGNTMRITIEPKSPISPAGRPGMQGSAVQLQGVMVDIK
ncbi:MAG: serine hydrolase [Bacteroidales bacterium]|nr:serine hydrolase [Bacteroidales bacterium]